MPKQASLYDLMVVLSTTAEDDRRAKILSDVEAADHAAAAGSSSATTTGVRGTLAYEIRHQREGEYHLLQFTGPAALLESLSHNLRIDDAVLRFRIIKVLPGTPPPPETAPPVVAAPAAPAPVES